MSWSELDIPDPEWEQYCDDCAASAPIHTFDGLKRLLSSMGYQIKKAEGYKAIDVADVTLEELRSGALSLPTTAFLLIPTELDGKSSFTSEITTSNFMESLASIFVNARQYRHL